VLHVMLLHPFNMCCTFTLRVFVYEKWLLALLWPFICPLVCIRMTSTRPI
jgi:hypothetical protein